LLDERVREVMAQGAAERGISEKLGAIRFAMMRLLAEEEDPVRLSLGVSRLANASARLAKIGREFEQDEGLLTEAISQILRELDGAMLPPAPFPLVFEGKGAGGKDGTRGDADSPAATQFGGGATPSQRLTSVAPLA
jgi:hypothetical protein